MLRSAEMIFTKQTNTLGWVGRVGGEGVCRGRQGSPDDEAEHHRDPL